MQSRALPSSTAGPPLSVARPQDLPNAGSTSPAVELVAVRKAFGDRVVLADVSMRVARGERVALLGESGSGKSTLLNLIAGLEPVDAGSVRVAGTPVSSLDPDAAAMFRRAAIGFVFQAFHLLPHLDAAHNVAVPLMLNGVPARVALERGAAMLARVGLGARANAWPRELSGGQEQRVGIARAIVTDPTLLLCDEPTGDLDRKSGDEILDLLQALNREYGKTIIMVTHDPHAAERSHRTIHLDKGLLREDAT